jgi:peptidoglycan/LPS O-acetylase OafA/YrhL
MNRQTELDGLRAVAILLVIAFHSWFFLQFAMPDKTTFLAFSDALPWFAGFIRRGDVGVDIFFVLSGFLLSRLLFAELKQNGRLDFKRFYLRRLFRIYPLYLVALAFITFGAGPSWAVFGNLFAYNIWFDPFDVIIPWTWSLSVELEYYAIAPFLILFASTPKRLIFLVLALGCLSIAYISWALIAFPQLAENSIIDLEIAARREDLVLYYKHLYVSMPVRLSQFASGLGAAWLITWRADKLQEAGNTTIRGLLFLALAGLALPLLYNPHGQMAAANSMFAFFEMRFGRVGFGLAIAVLITLMQVKRLRWLQVTLSLRFLEPIARFSFSMYLFHPVFVYLGIVLWVGSDPVTSVTLLQYLGVFGVTIVGSMALGFATWKVIENPAIRFGQRISAKT